jgi:hypothetical protein
MGLVVGLLLLLVKIRPKMADDEPFDPIFRISRDDFFEFPDAYLIQLS